VLVRLMMRLAMAVLVSLTLVSPAVPAGAQPATHATTRPGTFTWYSYTNDAGTRRYKLYVPASYGGRAVPLVVELHGCNPDNAEAEARWSRMNTFADRYGFIVAYPQQDPAANGSGCWNWFLPGHWHRDAGEPSIIAGITRTVMSKWRIDKRRVYVGGISAGGAMSDIMSVTYPDLYAAALVYAGCEYMGTATCLGSVSLTPAAVSGQMAYQEMGARARVVPVIVIQGDADPVVPFPNSSLVIQQYLTSDKLATGGALDPVPALPTSTRSGTSAGGQAYWVDDYRDAAGCLLAERYLVNGMLHQWSGVTGDGSATDTIFTDPAGPDVTTPIVRFFLNHPMPPHGAACKEVHHR
jgi:poly(hydroxyalkanoate) depolymerase family esterase